MLFNHTAYILALLSIFEIFANYSTCEMVNTLIELCARVFLAYLTQ